MKTAFSIDDALMEQVDAVARELGLSRSGLVAEALQGYLDERRRRGITKQLDEVFAKEPTAEERRLSGLLKSKTSLVDRW